MNRATYRIYAWCGPAMLVLFLVGFVVAGWLPPPSPRETAAQIVHDYRTHTNGIRVGMFLTMFGAALLGPWFALIASQLRRMGGRASAYCQLALGSLLVIEFIIPVMVFEVAAFRPTRPAALTLALSDLGWIMIVGVVSTAVVELILLGVSVMADRSDPRVFPRWLGPFSVAVGVIFASGGLVVFFKSGPFAWDGLLSWWIPLAVFGGWIVVMTALLLRAPQALPQEGGVVGPVPAARIDEMAAEIAALRAAIGEGAERMSTNQTTFGSMSAEIAHRRNPRATQPHDTR